MKEVNVLFVLFHITEHKPITDLQSTAIYLVKLSEVKRPTQQDVYKLYALIRGQD